MDYTIEATRGTGSNVIHQEIVTGKKSAAKVAREYAKKYPDCRVFVAWFRSSDGQYGYLNPDGNHAITGKAW